MMSLQSSTHSSQTNTEGPAMSLRTSCWLLPQNEQYSNLPSSVRPRGSSLIGTHLVLHDTLYSMVPTADAKNCVRRNALLFGDFARSITSWPAPGAGRRAFPAHGRSSHSRSRLDHP